MAIVQTVQQSSAKIGHICLTGQTNLRLVSLHVSFSVNWGIDDQKRKGVFKNFTHFMIDAASPTHHVTGKQKCLLGLRVQTGVAGEACA